MIQKTFEQQIEDEINDVDLSDCLIDPTKDHRKPLTHYKVNEHGDLLTWYWNKWHVLIERERLPEDDWICHRQIAQELSISPAKVCRILKKK